MMLIMLQVNSTRLTMQEWIAAIVIILVLFFFAAFITRWIFSINTIVEELKRTNQLLSQNANVAKTNDLLKVIALTTGAEAKIALSHKTTGATKFISLGEYIDSIDLYPEYNVTLVKAPSVPKD